MGTFNLDTFAPSIVQYDSHCRMQSLRKCWQKYGMTRKKPLHIWGKLYLVGTDCPCSFWVSFELRCQSLVGCFRHRLRRNFLGFVSTSNHESRKVPRNSLRHVEKAQANVEPKVQRVLAKAQSWRLMCWCVLCAYVYDVFMYVHVSHQPLPGIGSTIDLSCLVANIEWIRLWCPVKLMCALMNLHNLTCVQCSCCFFRIFLLYSIVSTGLVASIQ